MPTKEKTENRRRTLKSLQIEDKAIDELLAYNANSFDIRGLPERITIPLQSEPFASAWKTYAAQTADQKAWQVLRKHLLNFRFPVEKGVSKTDPYRLAVTRGIDPGFRDNAVELEAPGQLDLNLYASAAGEIALLITPCRRDFELLVQTLACHNEPVQIPESMGACTVTGYNNWDRVHKYERDWKARNPDAGPEEWQTEFGLLAGRKELYQDRFIILSNGPYSGVPAEALNLREDNWRHLSLLIRRDHECTHYLTKRLFGVMKSNIHDELIADFCGILGATGGFNASWLLRFMGLEEFPAYRCGGRLENYRGTPPLSNEAFQGLCALVHSAALNLEKGWHSIGDKLTPCTGPAMTIAIASLSLEELAGPEAPDLLGTSARDWTERITVSEKHLKSG